ncbi:myb-like protein X [Vespula maculifrons]|uniref:Myb-like protein X n=1 Tax=Vespula maculifrons TaxID=7453 RepID=A0ABD2AI52_VESMC
MAITTDLFETDIVLFYSATFEWWYEAREYIPSKGPCVSWFADCRSKLNFCSNEGIFLRRKDFIGESFSRPSFSPLQKIQRSREKKIRINNFFDRVLGYRTNVNLDCI